MEAPGWFGKLPALGDFASRRLPTGFIDVWDAWLQSGIGACRQRAPEAWLEHYLNAPIWRFLLLPGTCGQSMWAGALMPSVDKVGRHFPLTVAQELAANTAAFDHVLGAHDWFDKLEDAMLATLDLQATVEAFEQTLADALYPAARVQPHAAAQSLTQAWQSVAPDSEITLPTLADLRPTCAQAGLDYLLTYGNRCTLWWTAPESGRQTTLLVFRGLPTERNFSRLLRRG